MKKIFTIGLFSIICITAFGQPGSERRAKMEERMQSMRIAFITQKLALTPEESQNFWPVYNEFTNALEELKPELKDFGHPSDMSEEEASTFLDQSLVLETQQLDLKKQYLGKLKEVLPIQKIAMLHFIEREFKKEILNRVQRRSEGRSKKQKRN